jgi:hypothetical protein
MGIPAHEVIRSWPMGREVVVDPAITEEEVRRLVNALSTMLLLETGGPATFQVHILIWGDREKLDQVAIYHRNQVTGSENLEFRGRILG